MKIKNFKQKIKKKKKEEEQKKKIEKKFFLSCFKIDK